MAHSCPFDSKRSVGRSRGIASLLGVLALVVPAATAWGLNSPPMGMGGLGGGQPDGALVDGEENAGFLLGDLDALDDLYDDFDSAGDELDEFLGGDLCGLYDAGQSFSGLIGLDFDDSDVRDACTCSGYVAYPTYDVVELDCTDDDEYALVDYVVCDDPASFLGLPDGYTDFGYSIFEYDGVWSIYYWYDGAGAYSIRDRYDEVLTSDDGNLWHHLIFDGTILATGISGTACLDEFTDYTSAYYSDEVEVDTTNSSYLMTYDHLQYPAACRLCTTQTADLTGVTVGVGVAASFLDADDGGWWNHGGQFYVVGEPTNAYEALTCDTPYEFAALMGALIGDPDLDDLHRLHESVTGEDLQALHTEFAAEVATMAFSVSGFYEQRADLAYFTYYGDIDEAGIAADYGTSTGLDDLEEKLDESLVVLEGGLDDLFDVFFTATVGGDPASTFVPEQVAAAYATCAGVCGETSTDQNVTLLYKRIDDAVDGLESVSEDRLDVFWRRMDAMDPACIVDPVALADGLLIDPQDSYNSYSCYADHAGYEADADCEAECGDDDLCIAECELAMSCLEVYDDADDDGERTYCDLVDGYFEMYDEQAARFDQIAENLAAHGDTLATTLGENHVLTGYVDDLTMDAVYAVSRMEARRDSMIAGNNWLGFSKDHYRTGDEFSDPADAVAEVEASATLAANELDSFVRNYFLAMAEYSAELGAAGSSFEVEVDAGLSQYCMADGEYLDGCESLVEFDDDHWGIDPPDDKAEQLNDNLYNYLIAPSVTYSDGVTETFGIADAEDWDPSDEDLLDMVFELPDFDAVYDAIDSGYLLDDVEAIEDAADGLDDALQTYYAFLVQWMTIVHYWNIDEEIDEIWEEAARQFHTQLGLCALSMLATIATEGAAFATMIMTCGGAAFDGMNLSAEAQEEVDDLLAEYEMSLAEYEFQSTQLMLAVGQAVEGLEGATRSYHQHVAEMQAAESRVDAEFDILVTYNPYLDPTYVEYWSAQTEIMRAEYATVARDVERARRYMEYETAHWFEGGVTWGDHCFPRLAEVTTLARGTASPSSAADMVEASCAEAYESGNANLVAIAGMLEWAADGFIGAYGSRDERDDLGRIEANAWIGEQESSLTQTDTDCTWKLDPDDPQSERDAPLNQGEAALIGDSRFYDCAGPSESGCAEGEVDLADICTFEAWPLIRFGEPVYTEDVCTGRQEDQVFIRGGLVPSGSCFDITHLTDAERLNFAFAEHMVRGFQEGTCLTKETFHCVPVEVDDDTGDVTEWDLSLAVPACVQYGEAADVVGVINVDTEACSIPGGADMEELAVAWLEYVSQTTLVQGMLDGLESAANEWTDDFNADNFYPLVPGKYLFHIDMSSPTYDPEADLLTGGGSPSARETMAEQIVGVALVASNADNDYMDDDASSGADLVVLGPGYEGNSCEYTHDGATYADGYPQQEQVRFVMDHETQSLTDWQVVYTGADQDDASVEDAMVALNRYYPLHVSGIMIGVNSFAENEVDAGSGTNDTLATEAQWSLHATEEALDIIEGFDDDGSLMTPLRMVVKYDYYSTDPTDEGEDGYRDPTDIFVCADPSSERM